MYMPRVSNIEELLLNDRIHTGTSILERLVKDFKLNEKNTRYKNTRSKNKKKN